VRALALAAVTFFATAPAAATPPSAMPPSAMSEPLDRAEAPPREPERRFYGWQNIIVGYAGELLIVHGFFSESPMIMGVGAVTYTFGGAAVHGVHGNTTAAIVSPLILTAAPLLVTVFAASQRAEEAFIIPAIYLLIAPVLDGALGREPAAKSTPYAILPAVRRDSLGLSFNGAF